MGKLAGEADSERNARNLEKLEIPNSIILCKNGIFFAPRAQTTLIIPTYIWDCGFKYILSW